ncbi:unnamed protein product [Soboliphyme baturini]|uniref:Uncharacterized protein n=1 Tax=Soboliphyme baturini TaxID=241478 RepID=A0A183IQD6_9BILA|nr:unnamed protein product [Soboliphyme baturini]
MNVLPNLGRRECLTRNALRSVVFAIVYYPCSLGLTFFQQWFVKQEFHFPLFIVLCQFLIKFFTSCLYRLIYACICRRQRILLDWKEYVIGTSAAGITASLDIGLSNWSFQFITISL